MFSAIDRVYDAAQIEAKLGFRCRTGFAEVLEALADGQHNPPWVELRRHLDRLPRDLARTGHAPLTLFHNLRVWSSARRACFGL